jgi:hypothetical protein
VDGANIMFLGIIHRTVFLSKTPSCFYLKTQRFGDWILPSPSGKTYSVGPSLWTVFVERPGNKMETNTTICAKRIGYGSDENVQTRSDEIILDSYPFIHKKI